MQPFEPYVAAYWSSRDLTLGEFLSRVEGFLRGLREIDPVFSEFYVLGKGAHQELRIDDDFGNLQEIGLARAWDASSPDPRPAELDWRGQPSLASRASAAGWSLDIGTEPETSQSARFVRITINDCAQPTRGLLSGVTAIVKHEDSPLLNLSPLNKLLTFFVEFWAPECALVTDDRFQKSTRNSLTQEQLGWVNYRADRGFGRLLPPLGSGNRLADGFVFRVKGGPGTQVPKRETIRAGLAIQTAILKNLLYAHSGAYWASRDLTLGEFLTHIASFARGLREVDPVFSTLYVLDDHAEEELLDDDLENLEEIGLAQAWDPNGPKHWYSELDERGIPTLSSRSTVGWSLSFATEPARGRTSRFVYLTVKDGRQDGYPWFEEVRPNGVEVFTQDEHSALLNPVTSGRLFKYLVESWKPLQAVATNASFRDATNDSFRDDTNTSDEEKQLGWLNYRSTPDFARYLPSTVHREPLGQGVFFRLGDGRPLTEEDTAEVRAGLAIQAAIQNDSVLAKSLTHWGARKLTLGEFLSRVKEFLRGLKEIDPVFTELYVVGVHPNQELRLDDDFGNLEEIGLAQAGNDELPAALFTGLDEHGNPTLTSYCSTYGWGFSVVTEPALGQTSRYVFISITDGIHHTRGLQNLVKVFTRHKESPVLAPEVSERLFRYLVEFWNPVQAVATEARFEDATKETSKGLLLGRLNYRADPGFARYLPDTVYQERLGEGVFFRIGDGRVLTEEDTDEVRTALAIQAAIQNDAPPPQAS